MAKMSLASNASTEKRGDEYDFAECAACGRQVIYRPLFTLHGFWWAHYHKIGAECMDPTPKEGTIRRRRLDWDMSKTAGEWR